MCQCRTGIKETGAVFGEKKESVLFPLTVKIVDCPCRTNPGSDDPEDKNQATQ